MILMMWMQKWCVFWYAEFRVQVGSAQHIISVLNSACEELFDL